jgi:hypothetical protein
MASHRELATEWLERAERTQHGHYLAALYYSQRHYWMGVPVVLLTAAVGTSVFATLQNKPDAWVQISVGLLSFLATLLAALQTFLSYGERAEKHRLAGARYGAIGRRLELLLATDSGWEVLEEVEKELSSLAQESPNIPRVVHKPMEARDREWARRQRGDA